MLKYSSITIEESIQESGPDCETKNNREDTY